MRSVDDHGGQGINNARVGIAVDVFELAAFSAPPLTTVAQPKQQIGTVAADLLLDRVSNARTDNRQMILDPELRVRASTAPYQPLKENA